MTLDSVALWARQALFPRLNLAHVAAFLLLAASALANFRYGWSLGHDTLDKAAMAGASLGADAALAVGLTLIAGATHWTKRWAMGGLFAVAFAFAILAGLNFSAEVRGEHIGKRTAAERTDKTRINELAKIDKRIAEIGKVPAAGETKAQMDAILSDRRAGGCQTQNGPFTREHCPRYFQLKGQYEKALELGQLVTARNPLVAAVLKTDNVVAADPASANLAVYLATIGLTIDAANVPPWLNLLFVVLVVAGGPIMFWLAESRIPDRVYSGTQQTTDEDAANNRPDMHNLALDPEPPKPANENKPSVVVRPRLLSAVTPQGAKVIQRLEALGGTVRGVSQKEIAEQLGLARTTYRRVVDGLEAARVVDTSHDKKDGYKVALAA